MMKPVLLLTLGVLVAAPALAQTSPEDAQANAVVLPMIQEMIPGYHGQVVTACVVALATPEEKARLAAAPGPSADLTPVINTIMTRPELEGCVRATLQQ